ncbi:FHA domain-containing protein [Streptomyces mayteni]
MSDESDESDENDESNWAGWDDPDLTGGRDDEFAQDPAPDPVPETTTEPPPERTAEAGAGAPCWNCGEPASDATPDCPSCLSPRTHLVLRLDTPCLRLTAGPGRPLRLGRDPEWAPATAAALGGSSGVSRRHATITVERDGTAWVTEEAAGSLNGTWVNGRRVEPSGRQPLCGGDELALGKRVRGGVRIHRPPA